MTVVPSSTKQSKFWFWLPSTSCPTPSFLLVTFLSNFESMKNPRNRVIEQRQMPGLTSTEATWGRRVIKIKMPTARTVQVHLCHSSWFAFCALANGREYPLDHFCQGMGVLPTKACFRPRSSCPWGKYNPEGNTIEKELLGKMAFITVAIVFFCWAYGGWAQGSQGLVPPRQARLGMQSLGSRSLLHHCSPPLCQACFPRKSTSPREEGRGERSNACCPAGKPTLMSLFLVVTCPSLVLFDPESGHPQWHQWNGQHPALEVPSPSELMASWTFQEDV